MRPLRIGDTLEGRFRIVRELGAGRAHVVYEAVHRISNRPLALKLLTPDRAALDDARATLLREIRALGAVRHPRVVELYDATIAPDGMPIAALELLEGATLESLVARAPPLGLSDAVALARQVALALGAVHARRYAHGDVRAGNVFVSRDPEGDDRLRLIDFEHAVPLEGATRDAAREDVRAVGALLAGWVSTRDAPRALLPVLELTLAPSPAARYADGLQLAAALDATGLAAAKINVMAFAGPVRARSSPSVPAHRISEAPTVVPPPLRISPSQPGVPVLSASDRPAGVSAPFVPAAPRAATPRLNQRTGYVSPVQLAMLQGVMDGQSEDISEGGMQVVLARAVRTSERAQVRFTVPGTGEVVTCPAIVRWVAPRAAPAGSVTVGLEFVVVPATVRDAIARFQPGRPPTAR